MSNDNMKHRRLQELGESDFEIVEGQPDIRGWDVKATTGETIGEVEELILDAQARKVRYMVVDLDDDALDLEDGRTVLIPIGLAQLHEKEDDVLLSNVSHSQLKQLPEYDKDNLDEAVEQSICSVLGRAAATGTTTGDSQFYEHEHFNDRNLYRQRLLPQSTTTGEQSGIRFQQRPGYSDASAYTGDSSRSADRISNYDEVEDESLQAVSRDRSHTDTGFSSDSRQEDRSESPVERDIERRNREQNNERGEDRY